jgi:hypothetical protein
VWKAFFVSALLALSAHAEPPPTGSWRIWLEPRFMHQPVTSAIANAQKTELTGGTLATDTLEPLAKGDLEKLGTTWEKFAAQARTNAAADLAQLKPEYVRNRKKIIEYAALRSPKPIVASAVLAPGFRALFADTLGPDILVVMPNKNTAFVFPKLASTYQEYAPMVQQAYRESDHKVSMEVFEITARGMQAIGVYPDPARD